MSRVSPQNLENMIDINQIADTIVRAFDKGNKLLICGNGGSAAQAQHMAAELVGKFKHKRKALPAIALTTDSSILTSVSNDLSFGLVFSRQIEALGKKGDVLLTLSTSGESSNILIALAAAQDRGMVVIDLDREGNDTPEIQENHLKMIHKICELVEEAYI